jgi:multidrug resistance efflux pump
MIDSGAYSNDKLTQQRIPPERRLRSSKKAQVAQAMADVTQAQANQRRTELDVSRYAPLAKVVPVSQQEFDNTGEQILSRIGGNSHD